MITIGVVATMEVMLEPTRNPLFSASKSSSDVKAIVNKRVKDIKDKVSDLLKQRVVSLNSVGATEQLTVIVYLTNTNPADAPDLPDTLVFTVKKSAPTQVDIREVR